MTPQIIGAGLAGLITACRIKDADIYEAGSRVENHKALLRFRDQSVSLLTGIPFREVSVHKGIYFKDSVHAACTIEMANKYSRKVTGKYTGRSIWNLDAVKRYIAPSDFYDQLAERHNHRIAWNCPLDHVYYHDVTPRISTVPLPVMIDTCGLANVEFQFEKMAIVVDRYRLPEGTDLYQTIYFPEEDLRTFRASITGDLLIVESIPGDNPADAFCWKQDSAQDELCEVIAAFGMIPIEFDLTLLESVHQQYGKIIELPRELRESILYELTRDYNIFSIGRFATWRNILLDDVVKDIEVVERLLQASDYNRARVLATR